MSLSEWTWLKDFVSPGNDRTWKGSRSQRREGKTTHKNSCYGLGVHERTVSKRCEPNETQWEMSFLFVIFKLQRCPECAISAFHLLKLPGNKVFALSASNSTHSADEDIEAESLNLVELYIILVYNYPYQWPWCVLFLHKTFQKTNAIILLEVAADDRKPAEQWTTCPQWGTHQKPSACPVPAHHSLHFSMPSIMTITAKSLKVTWYKHGITIYHFLNGSKKLQEIIKYYGITYVLSNLESTGD